MGRLSELQAAGGIASAVSSLKPLIRLFVGHIKNELHDQTSNRAADPEIENPWIRQQKTEAVHFCFGPPVRTSCERTHDALLTAAQSGRGDDNVDGFRRIRSVGSVGRFCCRPVANCV